MVGTRTNINPEMEKGRKRMRQGLKEMIEDCVAT